MTEQNVTIYTAEEMNDISYKIFSGIRVTENNGRICLLPPSTELVEIHSEVKIGNHVYNFQTDNLVDYYDMWVRDVDPTKSFKLRYLSVTLKDQGITKKYIFDAKIRSTTKIVCNIENKFKQILEPCTGSDEDGFTIKNIHDVNRIYGYICAEYSDGFRLYIQDYSSNVVDIAQHYFNLPKEHQTGVVIRLSVEPKVFYIPHERLLDPEFITPPDVIKSKQEEISSQQKMEKLINDIKTWLEPKGTVVERALRNKGNKDRQYYLVKDEVVEEDENFTTSRFIDVLNDIKTNFDWTECKTLRLWSDLITIDKDGYYYYKGNDLFLELTKENIPPIIERLIPIINCNEGELCEPHE